jgi:5-oxoprolinase (ATP-hydrolysing)
VFYQGEKSPVFFVASRGHHADIGGITPGSMPPHSKYLHEEGAVFKSFKLVKAGKYQEQGKIIMPPKGGILKSHHPSVCMSIRLYVSTIE